MKLSSSTEPYIFPILPARATCFESKSLSYVTKYFHGSPLHYLKLIGQNIGRNVAGQGHAIHEFVMNRQCASMVGPSINMPQ